MDPRDEIRAKLTGPGGPFEIVEEAVLGVRMPVFKNRIPSLRRVLADSALRGDAEYVVLGDTRITFAQHVRHVASVARALEDRYGVRPGDRVAIVAANCPEWLICFWATVSLGAVCAALNGWWTADEIAYGVENGEPRLIVGDRKRLDRIRHLDLGVPTLEIESGFRELLDFAPQAELPALPIAEDDRAVILYTSGTTGRAKGAVATHRGICGFLQTNYLAGAERLMLAAQQGVAPPKGAPAQTSTLVTAPLFHLSGLYGMAVMMLAVGGKLVLRSGRFDPEDVLRVIESERITNWSALGSAGPRVVSHPSLPNYDVSSVRLIGFGGAPVSPTIHERIRQCFPNAAVSLAMGYGLSESVAVVASIAGEEYNERPTSTGRIMPTTDVEIRDEAGRALPEGREGEIFVRSPYVMREYWRNPEATAAAILPGRWLRTGDIGRFLEGYLHINSRARDMILRAAENVYPVEIEYRLEEHPAVAEAAVVGVEHTELGQEVKAIIVAAQGVEIDTGELARFVGERLAPFKVPSLWEVRREPLPRNAAGKVLKNVLTGEAESRHIEE